ncbi:hypothetical protein AB4099_20070 [Bosea sp. 2KB_26]|uniref:DUF6925 family protein n=1 Tax=Bosea sp. 2KB_26 TaxID=3237475 RepID=UPI003F8F8E39
MTAPDDIRALLRAHLPNPASQWNLGTFGAIAEFMRDLNEPVELTDKTHLLAATTARGGIGFRNLTGVTPFASESATGLSWNHRIALCLPEKACAMNRRIVLTELGPDGDALREQDREGILFDMGLDTLQVDICIRTCAPGLIAALRAACGRPLFEAGNTAMAAIVAAGPHRVFITRFGRCEVYQPIPPADGKSPEGPHTHVLPKLMRSGRTHAATEPVPAGLVPCAHLVPAHPVKDAMGRPTPFDATAQKQFQDLLMRYGDAELVRLKQSVLAAVAAGATPSAVGAPQDRFARHALRATLRQLAASGGAMPGLPAWIAAHDERWADGAGAEDAGADDAADAYGHAS